MGVPSFAALPHLPAQGECGEIAERGERAQGGKDVTVEPHLQVFEGLKDLEQDGNTSHVGGYRYPSSDAAFDAACNALKEFL